jgi:hypothetical protein
MVNALLESLKRSALIDITGKKKHITQRLGKRRGLSWRFPHASQAKR